MIVRKQHRASRLTIWANLCGCAYVKVDTRLLLMTSMVVQNAFASTFMIIRLTLGVLTGSQCVADQYRVLVCFTSLPSLGNRASDVYIIALFY